MAKVRYERSGAASILTIDRPERRNAVDAETAELLLDGFRRLEADEGARGLVLTGHGPGVGDVPHRPGRARGGGARLGARQRGRPGGRVPRPGAPDRRGPGRLSADDHALRSPGGDRGIRPAPCRWLEAGSPGGPGVD